MNNWLLLILHRSWPYLAHASAGPPAKCDTTERWAIIERSVRLPLPFIYAPGHQPSSTDSPTSRSPCLRLIVNPSNLLFISLVSATLLLSPLLLSSFLDHSSPPSLNVTRKHHHLHQKRYCTSIIHGSLTAPFRTSRRGRAEAETVVRRSRSTQGADPRQGSHSWPLLPPMVPSVLLLCFFYSRLIRAASSKQQTSATPMAYVHQPTTLSYMEGDGRRETGSGRGRPEGGGGGREGNKDSPMKQVSPVSTKRPLNRFSIFT